MKNTSYFYSKITRESTVQHNTFEMSSVWCCSSIAPAVILLDKFHKVNLRIYVTVCAGLTDWIFPIYAQILTFCFYQTVTIQQTLVLSFISVTHSLR